MKLNEDCNSSGFVQHVFSLDPDVIKAQRMQDLKDIVEYRDRHVKDVHLWSTDKEAFYKELRVDPPKDLEAFRNGPSFEGESVRYGVMPLKIREIPQKIRLKWWQRLWRHFIGK